MKLAAARFRGQLQCDERLILFDLLFLKKKRLRLPDIDQKMKKKREMDARQKKAKYQR